MDQEGNKYGTFDEYKDDVNESFNDSEQDIDIEQGRKSIYREGVQKSDMAVSGGVTPIQDFLIGGVVAIVVLAVCALICNYCAQRAWARHLLKRATPATPTKPPRRTVLDVDVDRSNTAAAAAGSGPLPLPGSRSGELPVLPVA